jgi:tRNA threonylcarbamoyl adenosine modification protein YeaZ
MKILALEFSSSQRSVAVARTTGPAQLAAISEVVETGVVSTKPIAMINEALEGAGVEREQVECLAVGLGPGSYTGIRTGIALAQGWQLARDVKLMGISSAECLAAQAQGEGLTGRVLVAIDAQRHEFYMAIYEVSSAGFREIEALRIVTAAEVQEHSKSADLLIGPDVGTQLSGSRNMFPRAATLARLASERTNFMRGEDIQPIYLRETSFVKAPRVVP